MQSSSDTMTSSLAAVRNPLLILLTSFFLLAAAQQGFRNVSVGDVLHADDQNLTWQSPSGDFEFGFCRVPDQQDRFLLAIWFAQIPNKTIVWSANGDNPVEIKSNVELTSNGLVLRAPSGMELWRSNSTQNGTGGVSHAAMLDTGNFVITGMNSDNIWESFQNPTDTILPGQELGVDSILSSAISRTSYKKGRFQLRFTSGYLVLNQIDVVTGKPFQFYLNITDGSSLIFNESGYILIRKSSGSLVELAPNNTVPKQDSYYRATLGFDGVFTLYSYSKTSYGDAPWASSWYIPEDICSSFVNPDPRGSGPCGYNSICQPNHDGRATCRCPDGFSVLNAKNPIFGCRPNYQSKPEDCNEEGSTIGEDRFEFNTMQFVDWPFADYELLQSVNEIECRRSCIVDCLCAVAILQPPERNNGTGRCWKKKLPLSNGWFNQEKIDRKVFIKIGLFILDLLALSELCDLGLEVTFSTHGCPVQDPWTRQLLGTSRKGDATLTTVYLINRISSSVINNKSSYECLHGIPLTYDLLKDFGCACFVLLPPHEHNKLKPKARLCCFLGYGITHKGYRRWDPMSQKLRVSRHVVFWEHTALSSLSNFKVSSFDQLSFFTNPFVELFPSVSDAGTSDELYNASPHAPTGTLGCQGFYIGVWKIDYEETFAPVARLTSVRSLLAIAAIRRWKSFQMNVKNAFLNGDLEEEVYMKPPSGLNHPPNKVSQLRRALYRLKQSPRAWYAKFSATVSEFSFTLSPHDTALFIRKTARGMILLLLYIDDMIIIGDDITGVEKLKQSLNQKFKMKDLGVLSYFLRLEVTSSDDGYLLSQVKYASDLVSKAKLSDSKSVSTPLKSNVKLTPMDGSPFSDLTHYRQLVGSLVYLTTTRPDIAYAVHIVTQLMAAPRSTHYAAILCIIHYAGDSNDRKSTTGYCFFLGDTLIFWRNKKQTVPSCSSIEAKYRALGGTTSELLNLHWLLEDMGVPQPLATNLNYVAVKKLEKVIREWEKEFKTEVNVIGHTHHRNLVRLFGYCNEDENRLLVYELMQNGSLASFLFGVLRPSWKQRLQIAFEIARGLTYLHEECSTQIIHCDIKPQNILLDDSFTAKISDFGLAKLLINSKSHTLTGIRGTKGYVAPEWFRSTPITVKVDVYSFGVMLLEIFCCRRCVELEMDEAAILTEWAYDCYSEGNLGKLVENDEEEINDMGRVEMLVKVAMWCVQDEPSQWPKMRTVTMMLEGALLVPAPPCPFLYSFKPKDSSIINPEFP
ncbi:hypothetical protein SLEP1_g50045 [Rubroshorea leprosula]|uniref:Uncharacterized protein n=1 Tax=Rubroshorea leprosula TaxID=152421 RepID=A0AAV5M1U8_9ROSI|nr:hypothetical protein SLEP1_g50045 [Rubroshorea leprosula]